MKIPCMTKFDGRWRGTIFEDGVLCHLLLVSVFFLPVDRISHEIEHEARIKKPRPRKRTGPFVEK